MTERALKVRATGEYRLFIEFEDGVSGEVDIADRLHGADMLGARGERASDHVREGPLGLAEIPDSGNEEECDEGI